MYADDITVSVAAANGDDLLKAISTVDWWNERLVLPQQINFKWEKNDITKFQSKKTNNIELFYR